MRIGKHREDDFKGVERQHGCSQGHFMTVVKCPDCKKYLWSNRKKLYCEKCGYERGMK